MSITSKPFSRSEKLDQLVFKPKPAILNDQDLNKAFSLNTDFSKQALSMLACKRENWSLFIVSVSFTDSGLNRTYTVTFQISKPATGNPAYFYADGIRYEAPVPVSTVVQNITVPISSDKESFYVVLVAKRTLQTFGTNPSLCGVSSSEFPNQIDSVNAYTWGNERLVYVKSLSDVSLGSGESIVGVVATIRKVYRTVQNGSTGAPENVSSWVVRYNAYDKLSDIFDRNVITTATPEYPRLKQTESRNNVWDAMWNLYDYVSENISSVMYAVVRNNVPSKLFSMLKENRGTTLVSANSLNIPEDGNLYTVTGGTPVKFIKRTELNNNEGSKLSLFFTTPCEIFHNASGTLPSGYKKVYLPVRARVQSSFMPESIKVLENTLVVLREYATHFQVEDIRSADNLWDQSGLNSFYMSLYVDNSGGTQTFPLSGGVALLKFNGIISENYSKLSSSSPYNVSTGVFTVPKKGVYRFTVNLLIFNSELLITLGVKSVFLHVTSGTITKTIAHATAASTSYPLGISGCTTIELEAGDTVAIKIYTLEVSGDVITREFTPLGVTTEYENTLEIEYLGLSQNQV